MQCAYADNNFKTGLVEEDAKFSRCYSFLDFLQIENFSTKGRA